MHHSGIKFPRATLLATQLKYVRDEKNYVDESFYENISIVVSQLDA